MTSPLLKTSIELVGSQVVVHVVGEVDLGTVPLLAEALAQAADTTPMPSALVADLSEVTFFGSDGISTLLGAYHRGKHMGLPLMVVVPSGSLTHRALEITGFLAVFNVVHHLDETLGTAAT